jgi:hypothetical protein
MSKLTLQELRQQERQYAELLSRVRDEIEEKENSVVLPALRKKYKGKYFKTTNQHSDGKPWWLYFHVTGIINRDSAKGWSFQYASDDKLTIEQRGFIFWSCLEKQITKREFDAAYKAALKKAEKFRRAK